MNLLIHFVESGTDIYIIHESDKQREPNIFPEASYKKPLRRNVLYYNNIFFCRENSAERELPPKESEVRIRS